MLQDSRQTAGYPHSGVQRLFGAGEPAKVRLEEGADEVELKQLMKRWLPVCEFGSFGGHSLGLFGPDGLLNGVDRDTQFCTVRGVDDGGYLNAVLTGDGKAVVAVAVFVLKESFVRRLVAWMGRIVVGIDGSASSREALRLAVHEAALRGDMVRVVIAWHVPTAVYAGGFAPK